MKCEMFYDYNGFNTTLDKNHAGRSTCKEFNIFFEIICLENLFRSYSSLIKFNFMRF